MPPSSDKLFQSSPALSSGRYNIVPPIRPVPPVSILAALSSGRYDHHDLSPLYRQHVSILARPFERALPIRVAITPTFGSVSILARPFERALPNNPTASPKGPPFQSSPALSSGRYRVLL